MSINENYPELIEELRACRLRNIRLSEDNEQLSRLMAGVQGTEKVYHPQATVAEMMRAFGQDVRLKPAMIADPKERELAAKLVLEEALEFVEAMGFAVNGRVLPEMVDSIEPDLVAAADAIGDILVVSYGAANRLGIRAYPVFEEIHRSNQSKVGPNGKVLRRESDGKVLKPESYFPPDLKAELQRQGWVPPGEDEVTLQPDKHAEEEPVSLDSDVKPKVPASKEDRGQTQGEDPDGDDLQLTGAPA